LKLFSLSFGVVVVVFVDDDAVVHFVEGLVLVKYSSEWRKKFGKDLFVFRTGKHVLDIGFRNHPDATMKDL
jgi:hypothetical protein